MLSNQQDLQGDCVPMVLLQRLVALVGRRHKPG